MVVEDIFADDRVQKEEAIRTDRTRILMVRLKATIERMAGLMDDIVDDTLFKAINSLSMEGFLEWLKEEQQAKAFYVLVKLLETKVNGAYRSFHVCTGIPGSLERPNEVLQWVRATDNKKINIHPVNERASEVSNFFHQQNVLRKQGLQEPE